MTRHFTILTIFSFLTSFRITFKYLFGLVFVLGLFSCSDDSPINQKRKKYFGSYSKKHSQISIENGPRQGFQYVDSNGTENNYRFITTTISNDSIVPIHLKISFSKEYDYLRLNGLLKPKVFLLPRELTPDRQHFGDSISRELKQFLDKDIDNPISLDEIINPNERLVMTFGLLSDEKYGEFMHIELITSDEQFHLNDRDSSINLGNSSVNPSTLYLGLNLVNSFIIPCGQISFAK